MMMYDGPDNFSMQQPSELNDLLMCESFFDNFSTTDDMDPSMLQGGQDGLDTRPSPPAPPVTPFSLFEVQLQALLAANGAAAPTSDFNSFDWNLSDSINATSDLGSSELLIAMSSPESQDDSSMVLLPISPLTLSSPSSSSSKSSPSPPHRNSLRSPVATFGNDFSIPSPPSSYYNDVKTNFGILDDRNYYQPQQQQQVRTMSVTNITTNEQQAQPQPDYPQILTPSSVYNFPTGLETPSPILESRDIPTDHNARKRRKSTPISPVAAVASAGATKKAAVARGTRTATAASSSSKRQSGDDLNEPMQAINIPVTPSNEFPPATISLLSLQKQKQQQQLQRQQQQTSTAQFSAAAALNQQKTWPNASVLVGMNKDGIKLVNDPTQKIPIQRLKPPPGPQQLPSIPPQPTRQQKKVAHNAIERRYRNNINDRIAELKNVVPALCHPKLKDKSGKNMDDDDDDDDENEIDGVAAATKLNKATILRKATEYIVYLKKSNERFREENAALKNLVAQIPRGVELLAIFEAREQEHNALQDQALKASPPFEYGEEEEFSSNPDTPPSTNATGGRALMALFMCLSFFAASPLTAGPQQQLNHHHEGRAMGQIPAVTSANDSVNVPLYWTEMLAGINYWVLIRTLAFILCVGYFCLPLSAFKFRRVNRRHAKKRPAHVKKDSSVCQPQTAQQHYTLLIASLPHTPPTSLPGLLLGLLVEGLRLTIRRGLGVEIMYGESDLYSDESEKWMRLSELECIGGNPDVSRLSMVHHCLKTINLIETIEENHIITNTSRIYATAAMQMALAIPFPALARSISQHLWCLAMYSAEAEDGEESAEWIESLLWDVHDDDREDRVDMIDSEVWKDALEIMKRKVSFDRPASAAVVVRSKDRKNGLKVAFQDSSATTSLAAASTVPIEILSNLQSYYNLQTMFEHLVSLISSLPAIDTATASDISSEYTESIFDRILSNTSPSSILHWYALTGAAIEAFWKNDVHLGERYLCQLPQLSKDVASPSDLDNNNSALRHDLTRRVIAYTLLGVAFLKRGRIVEGVRVLDKAQVLQQEKRKTAAGNGSSTSGVAELVAPRSGDLESSVRTLAEFVVGMCGLEAWIDAWSKSETIDTPISGEHEGSLSFATASSAKEASESAAPSERGATCMEEEVGPAMRTIRTAILSVIKSLRRMVDAPPLKGLDTTQELLQRLCRINRMAFDIEGDAIDSGGDCEDMDDPQEVEKGSSRGETEVNVGIRALRVLKGLR
ncbi:hypothetical protein BC937DRAFT_95040 [Endogone sp. FLAS-F59071]|nr:hypothetical protein BC937DRAFT_95040 [Endogone sp. FLAS-F59071]|eukprot:RUS20513.1 hypothetical protein BC937DRAFT_95040 [Endogone sp. FLAS-F59071]